MGSQGSLEFTSKYLKHLPNAFRKVAHWSPLEVSPLAVDLIARSDGKRHISACSRSACVAGVPPNVTPGKSRCGTKDCSLKSIF